MSNSWLIRSARSVSSREPLRRPSLRGVHDDPTLTWARANPFEAQKCLQCPPWDESLCDILYSQRNLDSLESYCLWRKWTNVASIGNAGDDFLTEKTVAISSHMLSAPLTLASFMVKHDLHTDSRVCCVGARAEASLPFDIWKECLLLTSSRLRKSISPSIDFVGPDIVSTSEKLHDRMVSLEAGSTLRLRWYYKGFLHDLLTKSQDFKEEWNSFVFFNPGFGHPHLKKDWIPTLVQLIGKGHPMLFTAHSETDALRDMEHLDQVFGLKLKYDENPFASRITYQDPFDPYHFVRPNHYVAHVVP